jgi:hypothetical protein
MGIGEVRSLTTDPFERAARREQQEEIRQELIKKRVWRRMRRRGGAGVAAIAMIVFGLPYTITALVRAGGFDFGEPTWGESLVDFFFGGRFWLFGAYTGFMLLLLWAALITWVATRGGD